MAELTTINVPGGDTFGTWIATTNNAIDRLNSIAPNANTISANNMTADILLANTVSANVVNVVYLTATGPVNFTGANTNVFTDHLNVTANADFKSILTTSGANTNIFGDHLNVTANADFNSILTTAGANTNIFSDHLNITANTNLQGITTQAGLLTQATDIAGAVNEVADNSIAYAIALG